MGIWIPIIGLSAAIGVVAGLVLRRLSVAVVAGAAIPWLGMLGFLLFNEYVVPAQGGGASMWPIALLIAGTAAAVVGAGFAYTGWLLRNGLGSHARKP